MPWEVRLLNSVGTSTTTRHRANGIGPLQPPHLPERFGATRATGLGADRLLAEARAARVGRCNILDYVRFVLVAVYLAAVMVWLVALRQIRPNFSFRRTFQTLLARPRKQASLVNIIHVGGWCYSGAVDRDLLSDAECISRVRLYEEGTPLPRAHSNLDEIRSVGGGRYLHWQGSIYFATSDNSDPRCNGRRYVYKEA
jgi:hypothetical protein